MTTRQADDHRERRNLRSDVFLGMPDEMDSPEAEELLRAAGVDPDELKSNLYRRAADLREQYQRSGQKSPRLLEQMLRDLGPDSKAEISAQEPLPPERIVIARLLEEIRRLPSLLNQGLQPTFSAAYRNRRELSPRDKDILDGVINDLLKTGR